MIPQGIISQRKLSTLEEILTECILKDAAIFMVGLAMLSYGFCYEWVWYNVWYLRVPFSTFFDQG